MSIPLTNQFKPRPPTRHRLDTAVNALDPDPTPAALGTTTTYAEDEPCSCHDTTDHDGDLDEWGRCQTGIDDADDDARREWAGDRL